jgi:CubicO group peptidase (beta-lactamase class C family)
LRMVFLASVYGHTGFTGTCAWVDPDNQLVYVFLSNRTYPNAWNNKLSKFDIRTRIQQAIYDAQTH